MNTTISAILLVLVLIAYLGGTFSIIRVGLKKWWVWLFLAGGFICAFLFMLLNADWKVGLESGAILIIMIMFGGVVARRQNQYYGEKAKSWLALYGNDSRYSFLARLIRHSTNKQNKQ